VNLEILDETESSSVDNSTLKASIAWWEKRRLWFNLSVGLCGILAILLDTQNFLIIDLAGIILYGLMMNVFYSMGHLLEALERHYFKRSSIYKYRLALFLIGTISSSLVTLMLAAIFYAYRIPWVI
jgi:hypothetical protein